MGLINEYVFGTNYQDQNFTATDVLAKVKKDSEERFSTTFKILGENVKIDIDNKGKTFSVSTFKKTNPSAFYMVDTYRKVGNLEKFAAFVADFSMEKLELFEKDEEYMLKRLLNSMTQDVKDQLLYKLLLKEKLKGDE